MKSPILTVQRFSLNFWIATILIVANLFTWAGVTAPKPYIVAPIRSPEVVVLLDHIASGDYAGETWEITLTELQAEQTMTWYFQRYPAIPFAHPRLKITPDYLNGEMDAVIAGLQVHVGAKVKITIKDGLPMVKILELSLPLPAPIRQAVEDQIQVELQRADLLPVRFTSAEWYEGKVTVRGIIR